MGPVVQVAILKGRPITVYLYKIYLLKKVKKYYERNRPKSGICNIRFLNDNVPAHKFQIVTSVLEKDEVHVLPHPPFDLFYLKLKNKNYCQDEDRLHGMIRTLQFISKIII